MATGDSPAKKEQDRAIKELHRAKEEGTASKPLPLIGADGKPDTGQSQSVAEGQPATEQGATPEIGGQPQSQPEPSFEVIEGGRTDFSGSSEGVTELLQKLINVVEDLNDDLPDAIARALGAGGA